MSELVKPLAITGLGVAFLVIAAVTGVECTSGQRAVISEARSDFLSIGSALRTYKINAGHYPSTEQGLQALVERPTVPPLPKDWVQVMTRTPTDPWRREFQYRLIAGHPDARFELRSLGPDGICGTADDRVSE